MTTSPLSRLKDVNDCDGAGYKLVRANDHEKVIAVIDNLIRERAGLQSTHWLDKALTTLTEEENA